MTGFVATYPNGRVVQLGDLVRYGGQRRQINSICFGRGAGPRACLVWPGVSGVTAAVEDLTYDPDPITISLLPPVAEVLIELLGDIADHQPGPHGSQDLEYSMPEWEALCHLQEKLALGASDG